MRLAHPLPQVVAHCDWSKDAARRWMAKAVQSGGRYRAEAPALAGELSTLFQRISATQSENVPTESVSALIGFDFPIGLPRAFADLRKIPAFLPFLQTLHPESAFFNVCRTRDEICLERPFYPHAPGSKKREHLTEGLGIPYSQLLRTCDQPRKNRAEAAALFWTMGAKQVGKAAIVGWRDMLTPAIRSQSIKIWPFHGRLNQLLKPGNLVVAETYPAEYYRTLFQSLKGSKTDQAVRAKAAPALSEWIEARASQLDIAPELAHQIQLGFPQGDDAFDAVIGLFAMLDVVWGLRTEGAHPDPAVSPIEGWILGQS